MESLWRNQSGEIVVKTGTKDFVRKENHWDVIVIGAGLAGILTAYFLQEAGKRVVILEANKIASGQTERTTAKITSQHGLKYVKLMKQVGIEKAKLYAQVNESAIAEYENIIKKLEIDCQFERKNAYLYTLHDEKRIREEAEAANELGIDAFFTQTVTELPFETVAAVGFKNQAQFSPLEFVKGIASELEIFEDSQVTEIKGNWVISKHGIMTADKIVMATHYPVKNVPGFYFLRQHQERSYVVALSGCEKLENMYYGIDEGGLSFRQAGEYLLLGGSGHRTGKRRKECDGSYEALIKAAKKYFPDCKIETRWAAQDCMPHDGIPFIGKYSIFTPDLYVATGFQKWGMTTSMIAARLLCDEICGVENPYKELFAPQRLHVRAGIRNLLIDVGESVKGLSMGLFSRKKCTHMGCKLVWNPDEQSWDCPCHGSRFDSEGKLIDNPAGKDIS